MGSNACLHLGSIRLNCALPGGLARGTKFEAVHTCIDNNGLLAVYKLSCVSPRVPKMGRKCCPRRHACRFNLGVAFWGFGRVGSVGGVLAMFASAYFVLNDYSVSPALASSCPSSVV